MNHTPGPLALGIEINESQAQIINSRGQHIAYVECDPVIEYAHLIVHCVNTHEALVEALQGLLDITDDPNLNWVEILDKIEKAKKALTLAEGKEQS